MRNYVVKPGMRGMFSINKETDEVDVVDCMRTHIDWAYQVPEDGILLLPEGVKKEVKKEDIVVVFYSAPYSQNIAVVINSDEWKENIKAECEYEKQQKDQKKDCTCCECDCCTATGNPKNPSL